MKILLWLFWALLIGGVVFWLVNFYLAARNIEKQYDEDWKCFRIEEDEL